MFTTYGGHSNVTAEGAPGEFGRSRDELGGQAYAPPAIERRAVGSYSVRPAVRAELTVDRIVAACEAEFGFAERSGDAVSSRYGAIDSLVVRPGKGELLVELRMNPKVANDVAGETVRRYNRFLATLTGYTAKERAKKAQKAAKAAAPAG
ncbi:MAG: DUF5611 family protein [Thermoplasmata archaeon]|nr:DUF5611 family protein [Thermoplasmata archaeon]